MGLSNWVICEPAKNMVQVKAEVKKKFKVVCQRHVHVDTNGKQPPVEHA